MAKIVTVNSSQTIGFSGFLFIALLVVKLVKPEAIDWIWVFSPLWIPFAILAVVGLIIGVIYLIAFIAEVISNFRRNRRRNKAIAAKTAQSRAKKNENQKSW